MKFGDSDKLRLGEWVIAIGNPFSLGGSVTAGIVSARNRDINSGPYDNYIQTDAAINRGNSGGPLFNLDGEVIGVNTAIISPSGGSIGIGFAVPSKIVQAVIDQLQQFGEIRRGWLGVRIQQVTDEIAESLNLKPARGALVAGVDDKGPAKPAGIEAGDVIVKFDGKDIKEMRDLPRIVADTPVGKDVEVIIVRKGKEEKKTVKLGRLEDAEKPQAGVDAESTPAGRQVGGAEVARPRARQHDRRSAQALQDQGHGQGRGRSPASTPSSAAADKRLVAGGVIVEVEQEQVAHAGRRAEARRHAEEGRQEDRAASGRHRRRRHAVRGAADRVIAVAPEYEGRPSRPPFLSYGMTKRRAPIALRVKQRRQIAVVDARGGGLRHRGLGVVGDAEAGGFDHRDVVGAVADRHAFLPAQARAVFAAPSARRAWLRGRGSARRPVPRTWHRRPPAGCWRDPRRSRSLRRSSA